MATAQSCIRSWAGKSSRKLGRSSARGNSAQRINKRLSIIFNEAITACLVQDGVPRASLSNLSRLVDEVVTALARSNRNKTNIILSNLTSKGRKRLRLPHNFLDLDNLPDQCQQVLDE